MSPEASFDELCVRIACHPEGLLGLVERLGYVPLLPFLEFPYAEVQSRLIPGLIDAGVHPEHAQTVSLTLLVISSLTDDVATHWADRALSWVEAGFPIDESVALALEDTASDKRFSQPLLAGRFRA
jgi:hypothetical protein